MSEPVRAWWRVETAFAVCAVATEDGVIVWSAPIFRRWVGRKLWRLEREHNATITALPSRQGQA